MSQQEFKSACWWSGRSESVRPLPPTHTTPTYQLLISATQDSYHQLQLPPASSQYVLLTEKDIRFSCTAWRRRADFEHAIWRADRWATAAYIHTQPMVGQLVITILVSYLLQCLNTDNFSSIFVKVYLLE